MKRTLLAAAVIMGMSVVAIPASADGDYGPDTCLEGYVWREAAPSDHVCVTPAVRDQTAYDNSVRESRWTSGPYGPHTCIAGHVWREAFPGDDVCVTPMVRADTWSDNVKAPDRRASLNLWITRYSDGNIPRIELNGDHFNFATVKLFIKYDSGETFYNGTVRAVSNPGHVGGSFSKRTGVVDCAGPGLPDNGYAQAFDVFALRWSVRIPVRIGCTAP
jgi:hypothetical protein